MLSMTRKFGLFACMAHQTWSHANERLRGALQNVGVEVTFRLGREDAERSAGILGHIEPLAVKHLVEDEAAVGRSHPIYYPLSEQREAWVKSIQDLRPRQALVKRAGGKLALIRTLAMPDPRVDPGKLKAVEEYYLSTYFRPRAELEALLARWRRRPAAKVTRTRRVGDR